MPENSAMKWDYTEIAVKHAKRTNKYDVGVDDEGNQIDLYQDRHIIGRDTPINKGVYFINSSEAVVVDDEKDPAIQAVYHAITTQIGQEMKSPDYERGKILNIVWKTVMRIMPYDHSQERIKLVQAKVGKNKKVYLSSFLGAGVCRHQGLLAAYLLEKLVAEQWLHGKVSIDRNRPTVGGSGHAWARYTTSKGEIIILDPAQSNLNTLDVKDKKKWQYARPEDLVKAMAQERAAEKLIKQKADQQFRENFDATKPSFYKQLQKLMRRAFIPKFSH